MDFPEKIANIGEMNLADRAGSFYSDLSEEAVPLVAEKLEDMKAFQQDLNDVTEGAESLMATIEQQETEIKKLQDTNTKLMFSQLKQEKKPDPETEDQEELDTALNNITLEEDD